MKNYFVASVCIVIALFGGCKKKSDPKMAYSVIGISDITVRQYADTTVMLAVGTDYQSGPQESVTLTPKNLPAGISVSPGSISGTPAFASVFTFQGRTNTAGSFPVTIEGVTKSGDKKTFTFNYIVTPHDLMQYSVTMPTMNYSVSSLPLTVPLNIPVTYISGIKETVTVRPDSLPTGVAVLPLSVSGTPTFTANIPLFHVDAGTPAGTYPIVIRISTPTEGERRYSFNLVLF